MDTTIPSTSSSPSSSRPAATAVETCSHCYARSTSDGSRMKVCGACKVEKYCSAECQKLAWRARHKQECGGTAARVQGFIEDRGKSELKRMTKAMTAFEDEYSFHLTYLAHRALLGRQSSAVAVFNTVYHPGRQPHPMELSVEGVSFEQLRLRYPDAAPRWLQTLERDRRALVQQRGDVPVAFLVFSVRHVDNVAALERGLQGLQSPTHFMFRALALGTSPGAARMLTAHLASPQALSVPRLCTLLNQGCSEEVMAAVMRATRAIDPAVYEQLVQTAESIPDMRSVMLSQP